VVITAVDFWTGGVSVRHRAQNLAYLDFMREHPQVQIRSASPGINIPGPASRGAQLMRFAGQTSPDIIYVYLSDMRQYIQQGFLAPLDDAVGFDRDGDGVLERDEVVWDDWWSLPQELRLAATYRGHVYAIPDRLMHISGLCYRRDLFAQAGLDPNRPPRSYDELLYAAQKLTDRPASGTGSGRVGLLIDSYPAQLWHHGAWDSGAELVMQVKHRLDGKPVFFPLSAEQTIDPQSGEDLTSVEPTYRATFDDDRAMAVLDFLHRLRWQRWVRAPSGEPVNLLADQRAELDAGRRVALRDPKDGQSFEADRGMMQVGVVRLLRDSDRSDQTSLPLPLLRGQAAMAMIALDMEVMQQTLLPRAAVGYARLPTPDGEPGSVQSHSQFKGLYGEIQRRPEAYRIAQQVLVERQSVRQLLAGVRLLASAGDYHQVPPPLLRQAGLDDLLSQVDPQAIVLYDDLLSRLRTEPYNSGWARALELFRSEVFDTLWTDERFDYRSGMRQTAAVLNTQVFVPADDLVSPYRPIGYAVLTAVLATAAGAMAVLLRQWWRDARRSMASTSPRSLAGRAAGVVPWLLLAPALFLIGLWSYYPLARGSVMAFEDYYLARPSTWVGIDNFLLIFMDAKFYTYCLNTVVYGSLTLAIGFFAPVLLAILLSEVPRGKVLFRTIFYLPSVTAGLVIMLLWKQMYEPTSQGLLNQLLGAVGLPGQTWLADPKLAMLCVIVPGVWAGMGGGSLIYLAALKSIPDELYEAASLDGAGLWSKLWHVTLPMLKPLLIINFVGAFIGAFQGMGNILVMTGGGPADATRVLALDIWIKSFAQLQFGLATAMAWILGVLLIGFTVMQLRVLRRVDFRRAEGV
jgi:multiple sugar transport system permease protein